MYTTRRENARWNERWGDMIAELEGELHAYTTEFTRIANQRTQTRADINRAAYLLRQIRSIEIRLEDDFHQPVEPFQP